MSEPLEPFSTVDLRPYLDVIDNFCGDMARQEGIPEEIAAFWGVVLGAIEDTPASS